DSAEDHKRSKCQMTKIPKNSPKRNGTEILRGSSNRCQTSLTLRFFSAAEEAVNPEFQKLGRQGLIGLEMVFVGFQASDFVVEGRSGHVELCGSARRP